MFTTVKYANPSYLKGLRSDRSTLNPLTTMPIDVSAQTRYISKRERSMFYNTSITQMYKHAWDNKPIIVHFSNHQHR